MQRNTKELYIAFYVYETHNTVKWKERKKYYTSHLK